MARIGHLGDSFGTDSTEVDGDGTEDGDDAVECSSVQSESKMEIVEGRGEEEGRWGSYSYLLQSGRVDNT